MDGAPAIDDLLGNLDSSLEVFERFQDLLLRERQDLLRLDVPAIERDTADKEELALRHQLLERERAAWLAGAGMAGWTLEQVAGAVAPPSQRTLLAQRGAELEALVGATRQMNELNRRLIGTSLASLARQVGHLAGREALGSRANAAYASLGVASRTRRAAGPAVCWEGGR